VLVLDDGPADDRTRASMRVLTTLVAEQVDGTGVAVVHSSGDAAASSLVC
jgi:hypothetical protein